MSGGERGLDDPTLGRLLSGRNEPSILEKEAALERLLAEVEARPDRKRKTIGLLIPALGLAAALALVVLPRFPRDTTTPGFMSRGLPQATLELRCLNPSSQERTDCAPGTVLAFSATPPKDHQYFSAFSLREDDALLWYFPEQESVAPDLLRGSDGPLSQGILIGADHPPGRYELVAVFSSEPLSRRALRDALGPKLEGRAGVHVIRRTFEVVPAKGGP